MAYVKVGNLEMEWESDDDYKKCLAVYMEFKAFAIECEAQVEENVTSN